MQYPNLTAVYLTAKEFNAQKSTVERYIRLFVDNHTNKPKQSPVAPVTAREKGITLYYRGVVAGLNAKTD